MKKENRKAAQQKRAAMKVQEARNKKIKKWCSILIPAAVIIVIILIAAISGASKNTPATDSLSTSASYQTDADLTVENGDTVNIDYVGSVDGVEFSGGSTGGMGADLVIGSGTYIDDFEEQLIGAHPGDHVDVVVTFPENYGVDELNGKEALFEVTVNGIYEAEE